MKKKSGGGGGNFIFFTTLLLVHFVVLDEIRKKNYGFIFFYSPFRWPSGAMESKKKFCRFFFVLFCYYRILGKRSVKVFQPELKKIG